MNCARSVIELITLYWPHSIDTLRPERASVDGFRPIFFSSKGNVISFLALLWGYHPNDVSNRTISRNLSLAMAKGSGSTSERINVNVHLFLPSVNLHTVLDTGILVRDSDARQRLKERLGEGSIIM